MPDLVIEFVPEDVRVKQAVYAEIEGAYPGDAPLIASGTSGLDLVELARKMKRPERFLGAKVDPYAWFPFGGGIRRCLGASFALMEMNVVLGTVLRSVKLAPSRARGESVTRRAITFAPARGGRIAVSAA